jgi:hypothetical protein
LGILTLFQFLFPKGDGQPVTILSNNPTLESMECDTKEQVMDETQGKILWTWVLVAFLYQFLNSKYCQSSQV